MAEKQFKEAVLALDSAIQASGGTMGFAFDGSKDADSIYKKFDRTEMIKVLNRRAQVYGLPAKQWVPLVAQIDFMSISERDLRLRFRNRVQAIGMAGGTSGFASASLKSLQTELDSIENS